MDIVYIAGNMFSIASALSVLNYSRPNQVVHLWLILNTSIENARNPCKIRLFLVSFLPDSLIDYPVRGILDEHKALKGGDKMFPDPDAVGMSIATSETSGLSEQKCIALQLAMEDEPEPKYDR